MKISELEPAAPLAGAEHVAIVQGGRAKQTSIASVAGSVRDIIGAIEKGDPGAGAGPVGILAAVPGMTIPPGNDGFQVSGFYVVGDEGAGTFYAYDPAILVADPPRSIIDNAGRGFSRRDPLRESLASTTAGAALVATEFASTVADELKRTIYADWWVKPGMTAAQVLAALKSAEAFRPSGYTLVIQASTIATVDTSGGLTNAVRINRPIRLRIDGILTSSTAGANAGNPRHIFHLMAGAKGSVIEGTGSLRWAGAADDANSGTESSHPGFIYCEADDVVFKGFLCDNPPKTAIVLSNCKSCILDGVRFTGGIANYYDGIGEGPGGTAAPRTGYFGININAAGGHIIRNCRWPVDGLGRRVISFVRAIGDTGAPTVPITLDNCYVDAWEKLAYLYGDGHLINRCEGTGSKTDWIRGFGSNYKIIRTKVTGGNGFASIYNGTGHIFDTIEGYDLKQVGIYCTTLDDTYTGSVGKITILNPKLRGAGGAQTQAIFILSTKADCTDVKITNPELENWGTTGPIVIVGASAPYSCSRLKYDGGSLNGGGNGGIELRRCIDGTVSNVDCYDVPGHLGTEVDCAWMTWTNVKRKTGTGLIGISGLSLTSSGSGNQYTAVPLTIAQLTLSAGVSTTVAHGGIAPNAQIRLTPLNESAAALPVWVEIAPPNFNVKSSTPAAGTEQFAYQGIQ